MAKYIDADELPNIYTATHQELVLALEETPAADVVEVVRCEECKYHENEIPGMVYCPAVVGGWVDADWFCKGGERRDD